MPLEQFFVAHPTDDAQAINNALARGENLLFTPGIYHLDRTLKVKRAVIDQKYEDLIDDLYRGA